MVIAGDEAQVEKLIGLAETEATDNGHPQAMAATLLRQTPLDPVFLSALAPALRDRVTSAGVEAFLEWGRLDDEALAVIEAAQAPDIDWSLAPRLDQAMMRLDLLSERPDAAQARIARLRARAQTAPAPGAASQVFSPQIAALAGEAALTFLLGSASAALPLFREAVKQHRKLVGKRKIGLPGEFALFHILAFLAAGETSLHADIARLLEGLTGAAPHLQSALSCLLALAEGKDQEAKAAAERFATIEIHGHTSRDPFGVAITTLALSGTPLENRLDELWSLFDTVTPGLLGSREAFQRRFSGPIEKGHGAHARQALKALIRPYLLRRTKAAVLTELPSRTEIALEVEPGPAERAFYEALRRKALENRNESSVGSAGGQKRIRILAEITRLRRAAYNPALIEPGIDVGSAKLEALLELVDELRAGRHRALVLTASPDQASDRLSLGGEGQHQASDP